MATPHGYTNEATILGRKEHQMSIALTCRRQTHHNNVGVLSDADQWMAHGR